MNTTTNNRVGKTATLKNTEILPGDKPRFLEPGAQVTIIGENHCGYITVETADGVAFELLDAGWVFSA